MPRGRLTRKAVPASCQFHAENSPELVRFDVMRVCTTEQQLGELAAYSVLDEMPV